MACMSDACDIKTWPQPFTGLEQFESLEVGGTYAPPSFLRLFENCLNLSELVINFTSIITTDTLLAFAEHHKSLKTIKSTTSTPGWGFRVVSGALCAHKFEQACQKAGIELCKTL